MGNQNRKSSDILQTMASSGLLVVAIITAIYGISQYESYKSEKRPYISLIKVNIGSSFSKNYLISHPELRKEVFADQIINADRDVQDKVEEIVVTLYYKNTGPIAAKDIHVTSAIFFSDIFTVDGKRNPNSSINDKTDFKNLDAFRKRTQQERVANLLALMPEQEKSDMFMFHRKEKEDKNNLMKRGSVTTNHIYLICEITYQSIKGDAHGYFGVYRLSHIPAYTRVYHAELIRSEAY